jgi:hypothetical protein
MATIQSTIHSFCSLGHNVNNSCRQCRKHTLEQWGIDADAYDAFALRETARQRTKDYHKRWDVPGDPEKAHKQRARTYGLTPEEYTRHFKAQGGVCAICKQPETRRIKKTNTVCSLAVDHDHVTGDVRGLLCNRCNHGLGYIERFGLSWVFNAYNYLRQAQGKKPVRILTRLIQ